jgi:POT family proton-dependent oligopeptide transporter
MVQIFNGLFVVMLAVPFSMLWDRLRVNDREPISPVKQAIGLALIAVSYFIIAFNVKDLGNDGLLAIKWLILLYLIQTCAELCLSPIGLSLVGKLAPKRFASLLYGVFFLSNASGYALAGTLGSILPATGDKFNKAKELGIDLQAVLDKTVAPTAEQLELLSKNQISASNPVFAGFEIHNLFEFFMVFVILTGLAAIILFGLRPVLKRMMHGVR